MAIWGPILRKTWIFSSNESPKSSICVCVQGLRLIQKWAVQWWDNKKLLKHTKAVQNGVGVEFVRGLWVNLIQKILMEFQQDVLLHAQTVKTNITMMDPF